MMSFVCFLFSFSCFVSAIQLQLSPSRPAAISMMETRNGIVDDMDDEMELTEFYNGAGSQSVDCEASPPSLQVNSTQFSKIKYLKKTVCRITVYYYSLVTNVSKKSCST